MEHIEILNAVTPIIVGILGFLAGNLRRESEAGDKALESLIKAGEDSAKKLERRVKALEDAQITMANFCGTVTTKLDNIERAIEKMNGNKT